MWDKRYQGDDYYYGKDPNDFLRDTAGVFFPGGRILSLGEGEGRNAVFLASRGFAVSAVDGSRVAVDKLDRFAAERGVTVAGEVADLAAFAMGKDQWDGIVALWCHLPSSLRRDVYARAVQALKPGGFFLLESYTPRQLEFRTGGPADVDMLSTLAALKDELKGLDVIVGREILREVQEGQGHQGRSAVVQFLGRRP